MDPTPDASSTADRALVAAFLACIALPAVIAFASPSAKPMAEMGERPVERPALKPTWTSVLRFPQAYRRYFDDNFGLRGPLIAAFTRVKLGVLDASPNAQVVVGSDGWLFYAAEHEDECCRNARPYTSGRLTQIARTLESRRARLEADGVAYLLVVAPDKHTVYGEFQPPSVRRVRGSSRLDQLLERLRAETKVRVLDLRPALADAKRFGLVYHKLDTHWNQLGAYVAYGRIVDALAARFPDMRAASRDDFELGRVKRAGDLAGMIGLSGGREEDAPALVPRRPQAARFVVGEDGAVRDLGGRKIDVLVSETPQADAPRLVMFRDSFASALLPFLAGHFARATYVDRWGLDAYDERVVERERPDVVIDEVVERTLMLDPPPDGAGGGGGR